MRLPGLRRFEDWFLPGVAVLALAAFFWFGLLRPLGNSLAGAVWLPEIRDTLRKGETVPAFAGRVGESEERLLAQNGLASGERPADGASLVVHPGHWTAGNVEGLFHEDAPQWRWILNSLVLAVTVTFCCAALSYPLAYWQARGIFPGKTLLGGMLLLPLILPPFVGAIGLRRMLAKYGTVNLLLAKLGLVSEAHPIDFLGEYRMLGCIIVMVLHFYPLIYLNLVAAISNVDPSLLESARNLGLSPWQVFRRVVLPLSIPGLVAGGSLVFIGAFTDLGTPLIFSYQEVVAQQIFTLANEQTSNPAAPALVAVVTLIVLALFGITRLALARSGGTGGGGVKGASRGGDRRLVGKAAAVCIGFHVLVILLALLPHLSVVMAGLAERWVMTAMPSSWTTEHVREALAHPIAQSGVRNSLLYAAGSTAVDVVLGLACAWVIVRRGGWWGRITDGLSLAPLAIPGIVLAFGYIGAYWDKGKAILPVGLFLILSYSIRRLPYTTRACVAGLEQTPKALEEAGGGLGLGPGRVLARVTVPLIAANVVAGAILAFAFAMLEVSDSLILATHPDNFPLTKAIVKLFERPGDGDQLASALGLFALVFMALSLLAAGAFLGRKWGEMFKA
ncbi:MAG: iron ABC transporter permease [Planctomycetes bacterium]|nr:iron ABC transporter permease [Planctomycetota bacterium]